MVSKAVGLKMGYIESAEPVLWGLKRKDEAERLHAHAELSSIDLPQDSGGVPRIRSVDGRESDVVVNLGCLYSVPIFM